MKIPPLGFKINTEVIVDKKTLKKVGKLGSFITRERKKEKQFHKSSSLGKKNV